MAKPSKRLKRIRIRIKDRDLTITELSLTGVYQGRPVVVNGRREASGAWRFFAWG